MTTLIPDRTPTHKTREIPRYIAVEGPVGAGKTTLATKLAATFHCETLLENAEGNPFLARFYQNRREAALATQLHFLFQRIQQLQSLRQQDIFHPVRIADFLIEKDRLFAGVNLDKDELLLYNTIYDKLIIDAPVPDLVIYLQAPVDYLQQRIHHRGIASEQRIDRKYLEEINEAYCKFFHHYDAAPTLIVNTAVIDFAHDEQEYLQLVDYLLNIRNGRHYYNPTFLTEITG